MKLKSAILALSSTLIFNAPANATVTLNISSPFSGKIASNFANAANVPMTGMNWGIIVDSQNDGFDSGAGVYDFMAGGVGSSAAMSFGGGATDDIFIPSTNLTTNSSALQENDFSTFGGQGTITQIAGIVLGGANNVTTGDSFALIWFGNNVSTAGSPYGFFTIGSFVIPSDGATSDMSAPFSGTDSIRPADKTFAGAAPVPEPSRVLLLGFGALGLVFRRRRS